MSGDVKESHTLLKVHIDMCHGCHGYQLKHKLCNTLSSDRVLSCYSSANQLYLFFSELLLRDAFHEQAIFLRLGQSHGHTTWSGCHHFPGLLHASGGGGYLMVVCIYNIYTV